MPQRGATDEGPRPVSGKRGTMIETQLLHGRGNEVFDEDDLICRQDARFTDQLERVAARPVAAAAESAV